MTEPKHTDFTKVPGVTVGMGLKGTTDRVSAHCWTLQCSREQRIRREWIRTYLPSLEKEEDEILKRFQKEQTRTPGFLKLPPEHRNMISDGVSKEGKGRVGFLKERKKMNVEERFGKPVLASQIVGWHLRKGTAYAQPSRWGPPLMS